MENSVIVYVNCANLGCNYEFEYTRLSDGLFVCTLHGKHTKKIIYDRMFRRIGKDSKVDVNNHTSLVCKKCKTPIWILEMTAEQAEILEDAFGEARTYTFREMFTEEELKKKTETKPTTRKPKIVFLDVDLKSRPAYELLRTEINTCFDSQAYSATIVLVRKLIESLLVDLLRSKFGLKGIDLFFIKSQRRFRNLSDLISNLRQNIKEFEPFGLKNKDLRSIEKLREEGNTKTHSVIDHATRGELLELRSDAKKAVIGLVTTITNIVSSA